MFWGLRSDTPIRPAKALSQLPGLHHINVPIVPVGLNYFRGHQPFDMTSGFMQHARPFEYMFAANLPVLIRGLVAE